MLTNLIYHPETNNFHASAAGYDITVSSEAFEKLKQVYIKEYLLGGIARTRKANTEFRLHR